jgi:hypothetical protein
MVQAEFDGETDEGTDEAPESSALTLFDECGEEGIEI